MYKRIIIKVGTKVLTDDGGNLDKRQISRLVSQVARLKRKGAEVVLVTSGAVGAGRAVFKLPRGTGETTEKQVFAAVGQARLMSLYNKLFEKHGYLCAQVLATKEDFRDKAHYFNMQNCLENLLHERVLPIVNENDVVAISELVFTDNDELTGLLASMLDADGVIILSSVDGVLDGQGKVLPTITQAQMQQASGLINEEISAGGRGGMLSKFGVAKKLAHLGIAVHIVNGRAKNVIERIAGGEPVGTLFVPRKKVGGLKRRIANSAGLAKGVAYINDCAVDTLTSQDAAASLLPIGVTKVAGIFDKGDIIEICDEQENCIGYGLAQYASDEAARLIGQKNLKPLVHYDQLFILA